MCQDCGCSAVGEVEIHSHPHHHEHHHHHHPAQESKDRRILPIAQAVLSQNNRLAERNRNHWQAKHLLTLNLLSSPGSGKTALLERTARDLEDKWRVGVIVGDLATDNDAQRLRSSGAATVQILTGTACHLEAAMVAQAAQQLDLEAIDLLAIENVGNLVCPAAYDLGEDLRVVLLAVTEGEDKPLKYPATFQSAQVAIINKIDLAEVVGFDRELALANLRRVAPQATIIEVSARTGAGMEQWYRFLQAKLAACQGIASLN